jgi:predicted dehydrogenase
MAAQPLRVLVVGCGHMGAAHARAYARLEDFRVCGLVSRGPSKNALDEALGGGHPLFDSFERALEATRPDAVCVATYPDTHEAFALAAIEAGAHVFLEKPIAPTVEASERVVRAARAADRRLVVGYILRHHPSWIEFIRIARTLGKPLVMRMNLNQQSSGEAWKTHRSLLESASPIVDCGVHYVDVMCQMTQVPPVSVSAIGARLVDDLVPARVNYGQLQVRFEDGSVGWYEAGWGPMMSETAFFVKDVVGPKGCVSIVAREAAGAGRSDDVDSHTKTESLRIHFADLDGRGRFAQPDRVIEMKDEPDHDELCRREQAFFLRAIREDLDLGDHWRDAVESLRIVLAADESIRTGRTVELGAGPKTQPSARGRARCRGARSVDEAY